MKSVILIGVLGALATGIAIGVQSTFSSRLGSLIGHIRTGLFMNFIGGIIAGLLVLLFGLVQGREVWRLSVPVTVMLAIAGALGILVITGIAFSLQRIGVAAGLATVILGQLVISVISDTRGLGGSEPIPFTFQRLLGLLVMALGVYLLLPKK